MMLLGFEKISNDALPDNAANEQPAVKIPIGAQAFPIVP